MPKITNDWLDAIGGEFEKDYYKSLRRFLASEYKERTIYPAMDDIFNAFHMTPLSRVKVLIIGQDPYHGEGQAMGASFSVPSTMRVLPPSLVNIFKELSEDIHCPLPTSGDLSPWARQGVLLLNTVLTVRAHEANSHKDRGWEMFTDAAIRAVNAEARPIVCILWGASAQSKAAMLTNPAHLCLSAPHPSPLSAYRGFFGSKPFSKANEFLSANGCTPIDWQML